MAAGRFKNEKELLSRLGQRLRAHRRARGMTQEALAEAVDLSVAYVSLLERGGRNPPYTTLVSIASALDTPVRDLCDAEIPALIRGDR